MYSWKLARVWMKTGSRLEVNWKKLEGDWYKSGSTKF